MIFSPSCFKVKVGVPVPAGVSTVKFHTPEMSPIAALAGVLALAEGAVAAVLAPSLCGTADHVPLAKPPKSASPLILSFSILPLYVMTKS